MYVYPIVREASLSLQCPDYRSHQFSLIAQSLTHACTIGCAGRAMSIYQQNIIIIILMSKQPPITPLNTSFTLPPKKTTRNPPLLALLRRQTLPIPPPIQPLLSLLAFVRIRPLRM